MDVGNHHRSLNVAATNKHQWANRGMHTLVLKVMPQHQRYLIEGHGFKSRRNIHLRLLAPFMLWKCALNRDMMNNVNVHLLFKLHVPSLPWTHNSTNLSNRSYQANLWKLISFHPSQKYCYHEKIPNVESPSKKSPKSRELKKYCLEWSWQPAAVVGHWEHSSG